MDHSVSSVGFILICVAIGLVLIVAGVLGAWFYRNKKKGEKEQAKDGAVYDIPITNLEL